MSEDDSLDLAPIHILTTCDDHVLQPVQEIPVISMLRMPSASSSAETIAEVRHRSEREMADSGGT